MASAIRQRTYSGSLGKFYGDNDFSGKTAINSKYLPYPKISARVGTAFCIFPSFKKIIETVR